MDFTINFDSINLLVVFGATVAGNLLGALWYSPIMFGKPWAAANNIEIGSGGIQNVPGTFVTSFILQLVAASMIAALLGPSATGSEGMLLGAVISVSFVFTAMGITNLFERRRLHLIAINSAFHIVCYTMMGFIIGRLG